MVDQGTVCAVYPLRFKGLEHGPGVLGEGFDIVQLQRLAVVADQEEPVAAPGNIALHAAMPGYVNGDLLAVAVGGHIAHSDLAIWMQGGGDRADRGVDLVFAGLDQAQVMQGGDQTDGAVPAHAQITGIVEEDHAAGGICRHRLAVQRADQYIVATGLQQAGPAPLVMLVAQGIALLGNGAPGQVRKAFEHQAGGFAAGM